MTNQSLTLTYFKIKGLAEAARLAFVIGDIKFNDVRLDRETFIAQKQTFPFAQLPILQVNDTVLAQSNAITRYAGRLAKLYPEDPLEAALVDQASLVQQAGLGSRL